MTLQTVSLQAGEHQRLRPPRQHLGARRRREQDDATRDELQTAQSQISGKSHCIHPTCHQPPPRPQLQRQRIDERRGLWRHGATSRHHALWSCVYTERHVNDEEGYGGAANYAGRRRGEIEDTGASNIEALERNHS